MKNSNPNFELNETPFSLKLNLKKSFVQPFKKTDINLLDEVEEFSFDGKVIMSNCVCNQCGKIFDKRGGKERHVNNVHLKQSKSVFKQSDDIDSNNGGSACILKYEDIKVEIDPASLKCEPFDLHCLEGDFGLKEEDIKKVNLVPKNPEIKEEDVIP